VVMRSVLIVSLLTFTIGLAVDSKADSAHQSLTGIGAAGFDNPGKHLGLDKMRAC